MHGSIACAYGQPALVRVHPGHLAFNHVRRAGLDAVGRLVLSESNSARPFRKITCSIHEAARDVSRRIAGTPEYLRSRHEREKVEMLFAHLKRILKLDRLRLRGLSGASNEFTFAAAVQNLQRLAKLTAQG